MSETERNRKIEDNTETLISILENDGDLQGFGYNMLSQRVEITGFLPWDRPEQIKCWRDADTAQLKSYLDYTYARFSDRTFDIAFTKVADDRRFHPIRDYIIKLPAWDDVPRVEELFIKYLQADDTPYVRTVTRKMFVAAMSRIMTPGCKFDCVPVLDGAQGIGKSSIVKDLVGPEFYSESLTLTDLDDKSGAEKLQGYWVVEIGELAGMKKADIEKVKSFLSTSDDKYRPSYGRVVESHPRQCIIIGTVNGENGYLRDITGNRRFWIIPLHQTEQKRSWNFDDHFRDQFWAEVWWMWQQHEPLYLEGEILEESERLQRTVMESDDRLGMVEEYLEKLLPDDWNSMDLYARRKFLAGEDVFTPGTVWRMTVSNAEIWCECFGRSLSDMKAADSYAIASIMEQIEGWMKQSGRSRLPFYGQQRVYVRCDK